MFGKPIKRIVRQYGYSYPYSGSKLTKTDPFPEYLQAVVAAIKQIPELNDFNPDQAIINRYMPGEHITAHIDDQKKFGDTVVSVTLGATGKMIFTQEALNQRYEILAKPMSAYVMQGDARKLWKHEMSELSGSTPRFSITFRTINESMVDAPATKAKVPIKPRAPAPGTEPAAPAPAPVAPQSRACSCT
jgi:alkylated DNA repair dioxygenase AlkB